MKYINLIIICLLATLFACNNTNNKNSSLSESQKKDNSTKEPIKNSDVQHTSETTKSLRTQMWDFAKNYGYNMDDADEIVDDASNGYISFDSPYDGAFTMGAFKDSKGKYLLLMQEKFFNKYVAPPEVRIKSNKNTNSLFPKTLTVDLFAPNLDHNIEAKLQTLKNLPFYIECKIPQKGTKMKVSLKLELLNYPRNNNKIYSINGKYTKKSIDKIAYIAQNISEDKTINYLLNKEFNKINLKDKKMIKEVVNDKNWYKREYFQSYRNKDSANDAITSMEKLAKELGYLQLIYQLYKNIKYDVIVDWNMQKAQFFVVKKQMTDVICPYQTFKEFITDEDIYNEQLGN